MGQRGAPSRVVHGWPPFCKNSRLWRTVTYTIIRRAYVDAGLTAHVNIDIDSIVEPTWLFP